MIFRAAPAETPLSCIKSVSDASLMLILEGMTLTGAGLRCDLSSAVGSPLGGLASTPDAPTPRQHSIVPKIPIHRAVSMELPPRKDELLGTIRLRRGMGINASNQIRRSVSKAGRWARPIDLRFSRSPPYRGATRTRPTPT